MDVGIIFGCLFFGLIMVMIFDLMRFARPAERKSGRKARKKEKKRLKKIAATNP